MGGWVVTVPGRGIWTSEAPPERATRCGVLCACGAIAEASAAPSIAGASRAPGVDALLATNPRPAVIVAGAGVCPADCMRASGAALVSAVPTMFAAAAAVVFPPGLAPACPASSGACCGSMAQCQGANLMASQSDAFVVMYFALFSCRRAALNALLGRVRPLVNAEERSRESLLLPLELSPCGAKPS